VSTHEPRKNITTLARAYVELLRELEQEHGASPRPDLVLVGRRSQYSQDVERIVGQLPEAAARTHVLTIVSDRELAALYRGALATAVPSICEGFGFPLVEALVCGSRVLVADQPVFHELVGDAATYVAPFDVSAWTAALRELVERGHDSRGETTATALEMRSRFQWQAAGRATLAVLEEAAR
jgi:glycosyltransferase involved in cell wall biosynthesis